MTILKSIRKEIKDVPVNRLEEIYQMVHALVPSQKHSEAAREKILSYGGSFSDMSNKDYDDFVNFTRNTRSELFDRSPKA